MAKKPVPQPEEIEAADVARFGLLARVIGPAEGRRRIGRHFGPEGVLLDSAELSAEERRAILSDPLLRVVPAEPKDVGGDALLAQGVARRDETDAGSGQDTLAGAS